MYLNYASIYLNAGKRSEELNSIVGLVLFFVFAFCFLVLSSAVLDLVLVLVLVWDIRPPADSFRIDVCHAFHIQHVACLPCCKITRKMNVCNS